MPATATAGYTHLYIHPVGADQESFSRFWETVLPARAGHGQVQAS